LLTTGRVSAARTIAACLAVASAPGTGAVASAGSVVIATQPTTLIAATVASRSPGQAAGAVRAGAVDNTVGSAACALRSAPKNPA
jgi:hypothetical protein